MMKNTVNNYIPNNIVNYNSPIALIEIQSQNGKIISLYYVEEKRYSDKLNPLLAEAKRQLKDYFNGKRKIFDLPIKLVGTDFQKKVWNELTRIPYGQTLSYKDIAKCIGNENASRAVGNANNKNNLSIIIPCHRVIGSNNKLVGYAGGLWRKKWLLEHEELNSFLYYYK